MKGMGRELEIISIAALYSDGQNPDSWQYKPDYKAFQVNDIIDIVNSLNQKKLSQIYKNLK